MVKVNRRYSQALVQWSATGRFPVGMEPREVGILETFVAHLSMEAEKKDMDFKGFLFLHMGDGCLPIQKYKMIGDFCDVVKTLHGLDHECYTERLIAFYTPQV